MSGSLVKILIVDDNEDVREMLSFCLKHKGFEVFLADNGLTALEILEKNVVDLVLSDIDMPKMDGMELLIAIKKKYTTPVYIATGGTKYSKEELLKQGATAYFEKPFDVDYLLRRRFVG